MANTTNQGWARPTVGASEDTWGATLNTTIQAIDTLVGPVTAAEIAKLDGLTSSTAELNKLTGVTTTAAQLNFVDGVTSAIQTQLNAVQSVPAGGIIMWSGLIASIPGGWYLCDGTNSTPNLTDRFIIGSATNTGGTNNIGDTGGASSLSLTTGNLPSHTHDAGTLVADAAGEHSHTFDSWTPTGGGSQTLKSPTGAIIEGGSATSVSTSTAPTHTHTISGSTASAGSGTAIDNRPAYFALAFIMKS